ncbi:hypothetical protein B0J11DRAFT_575716 [Dendryphion nanum]|uniref:DUF7730 domain-containing protein n=1 Tax=Dendryphion nanum TaxID=256645 RepID=A0A9P9ITS6_9PLEO|nr:hypothetical protein B0J11DRAFT_575716 [Dendryphion nanum]
MSDPIPDCPLLQKLPAELRLMIWEFTIGHQYIHIRLKPKLGHTVRDPVIWKSKLPTAAFINDKASNNMSDPPRALDSFSLVSRKEHTVGGLFRACKQTHRESIKILYATNTFIFTEPWLLPTFKVSALYWDLIRSIYLDDSNISDSRPQRSLTTDCMRTGAVWHPVHSTLSTLPNVKSVEFYIPKPYGGGKHPLLWKRRDFDRVKSNVLDYFNTLRRKEQINNFEVYIAVWEADDANEVTNFISFLTRSLRRKGFNCKVFLGGIHDNGNRSVAQLEWI